MLIRGSPCKELISSCFFLRGVPCLVGSGLIEIKLVSWNRAGQITLSHIAKVNLGEEERRRLTARDWH